ncbi:MAG: 7-cyano-7-deazaguanine synthase QueC [Deltaproteobacteria bacterium]|nr:7-cyano-7-deazaguanine synthase QueC [Deltaproteobacteria bacterium]
MKTLTAISILSGGLDSSVATLLALQQCDIALALTFNYGQRAFLSEKKASALLCRHYKIPHQIVDLTWLASISQSALNQKEKSLELLSFENLDHLQKAQDSAKAVWVPNRNGLFINAAACFAEAMDAKYLITGFNLEEAATFPDNSMAFVEGINVSLSFSTLKQIQVRAPLAHLTKKEIVQKAIELELSLDSVWSCYESGEKMCGICESCLRSKRAYLESGLKDKVGEFFK